MTWPEILQAAMVGTQQQGDLQKILDIQLGTPPPSIEAQILLSAARQSLALKSGFVPLQLPPNNRPAHAPAETLRYCPAGAVLLLEQLLDAKDSTLLGEFIRVGLQNGYICPPPQLAMLLEVMLKEKKPEWLPFAGERGTWLVNQFSERFSALQPKTLPTSTEALTELWETGTLAERKDALAALRKMQPESALELMASGWKKEPANAKKQFLEVLADQLSASDMPFLEQCLKERSKDVRLMAMKLLAQLTDSAFTQRLTSEVLSCIRRVYELLVISYIEIYIPAPVIEHWKEMGIGQEIMMNSWMNVPELVHAVSLVHPSAWVPQLGKNPTKVLEQFFQTEELKPYIVALWESIVMHRQQDWALEALQFLTEQAEERLQEIQRLGHYLAHFMEIIGQAKTDQLLTKSFDSMALSHFRRFALAYPFRDYSESYSMAIAQYLIRKKPQLNVLVRSDYSFCEFLVKVAQLCSPTQLSIFNEASQIHGKLESELWFETRMINILDIRQKIYHQFQA
jgi:hypothetical protein